MTINYTTNLSLAEPVTGTESGTWGDDVNKGLTDYLDISIAGTLALTSASFTANALTLANTTGSSSSNGIVATTAQYYVLKVSSLAANVTITAPSSSKSYIVVNNDPTYTVTIKASGQTGVTVAVSSRALVVFNGTDYAQVGASAGGSNTQVQYNSSGALAGSSSFTWDGTSLSASNFVATASTTGSSSKGAYSYGTLSYSDVNHILTMQASQNSYIQMEIQNTNAGASASSDVVVGNNNTTASTYYGDFGMNSSGFSGTGALGAANNVYLTATSVDLALGTTTSNPIHFVIGGSATDAMTINTSGAVAFNNSYGTTSYVLTSQGSGSPPIWAAAAASGPTKAQAIAYAMTLGF
jgi:hypothetical protein